MTTNQGTTPIQDRPAFDSTRKALEFAFNADASFISPPTMNKMMSAVVNQGKPIKKAEEEDKAWGDISAIFDQTGVTGLLE